MRQDLHVGTSGWSYPHWSGPFYPEDVKPARFLEYYTTQFDCVELNASFYRLPAPKTVEGWARRTPENFRFCAKVSRFITHRKRLVETAEPLERFLAVFEPLRGRLGPFLVQLPPSLRFDPSVATAFLEELDRYRDRYAFALEARHASWFTPEALGLLARHGVASVLADSGGRFPEGADATGPLVYLRFHGPDGRYTRPYTREALAAHARRIRAWLSEGRQVWAFFNNDTDAHAVFNARDLRALVEAEGG